jgi:hypothetical protein
VKPTGIERARMSGFKGNKQSLPTKPCVACGRPMSWRKRWARTRRQASLQYLTSSQVRAAWLMAAPW